MDIDPNYDISNIDKIETDFCNNFNEEKEEDFNDEKEENNKNSLSHQQMETYMMSMSTIYKTTSYHYCPHYILPNNINEEIDETEIFFANVYSTKENNSDDWKLGSCLISMSKEHPLHPCNKKKNVSHVKYEDAKWVVSLNPILFDIFYELLPYINYYYF